MKQRNNNILQTGESIEEVEEEELSSDEEAGTVEHNNPIGRLLSGV